jgi:NAD-dependent dihydropyrimidine dehydrogenase PreA subunit
VAYVISGPCIDVNDRACMDECPVDCIYEGERKSYINPKECIDCGACEPACPVEAISQDRKLEGDARLFIGNDRSFFVDLLPGRDAPLGAPGGSRRVGVIGVDTPLVADWSR